MRTRRYSLIRHQLLVLLLTLIVPAIALSADVKILSWNVYMLPMPIKNSLQAQRNQAIPELLENSDYDIMFFQEAFTGSFRKSMIKQLGAEYPHNYYFKRSNLFSVFGSGVFVMSRYPFKILDKIRYKDCSGADCYATKGTLLVEVSFPSGKTVQFAPTHLNSQRDKATIRAGQIAQIRTLFQKYKKRGVPQVILGDLNIVGHGPEFFGALKTLDKTPIPLSGPIQTTSGRVNDCYKTTMHSNWLDHVWVSREEYNVTSTLEVIPTEFEFKGKNCPLSDHHAIEAHLSFN